MTLLECDASCPVSIPDEVLTLMPQNKTPKAEIASGVFYLYGRSEVGDRRNLVVSALCVK
ncbi:MAG: hypothetical protein JGK27_16935 [Microcoleus sp. PH2017_20_SFW_D_A]|uniref:hypothetical protein n=1 Tax=unclassified Microcoleus TaxID=2642155 RepID=UPI001D99CDE4|nr:MULTISPECIES: hypothetical protein [unclassified Microcoleus]MCC3467133.1 hypothetical protein [Microcoleus sp. PH2017_06_SFM_O_A]MCC3505995.1 hypothetical protein [Microcoleus sp. PH2017_19_SFW_U_A]MCC3510241.1 hypothetical protein [Microcoleus sp. PH2017_17_BER_D_A]MCC3523377.1 hypothetical protein [Microcoleus sp. PH2017_20_SFW_D_A]MCC3555418.1 hypothetical protein [Microcoleus sp. PH2017_35_SFW_U_B]MCC3566788.1 hypothetical protein [Microcoleus sp. PH2017_31_RDM_U_A]MCC3583448.1 hypot